MIKKSSIASLINGYFNIFLCAVSVYISYLILYAIIGTAPFNIFHFGATLKISALALSAEVLRLSIRMGTGAYCPSYRYEILSVLRAALTIIFLSTVYVIAFAPTESRVFIGALSYVSVTVGASLFILKLRIVKTFGMIRPKIRRTLIVSDSEEAVCAYLSETEKNPSAFISVVGLVGEVYSDKIKRLGGFEDFRKVLSEVHPNDVIFAAESLNKSETIRFVNDCDECCARVYFMPMTFGYFKSPDQIESLGSLPLINAHSNPLEDGFNSFIKRSLDVIGSLILIIATLPLMLFAAIGIKLTSKGPIIFKQERVGIMGKKFLMYKFRSMPVNKEREDEWSTAADARPTRFGSFLRRTAIDELPQFFNVLSGQMSLVGPRPEIPKFVNLFKDEIPLYMIKHYVKPGITGLAQIQGLRGDTSIESRIQEDINYIENWSIWLDALILIKTPFRAFNRKERYVKSIPSQKAKAPPKSGKKILYAASSEAHLKSFHQKYVSALKNEGHTVLTLASGEGADFNVKMKKRIISATNLKAIHTAKKILKEGSFDIIILNTSLAAFVLRAALGRRRSERVVNIVHGYLFSEKGNHRTFREKLRSFLLLFAEKLLKSRTDAIIVMNSEDYKIAKNNKLCIGDVFKVDGLGVPKIEAESGRTFPKFPYSRKNEFIILFVGELSKRKNQSFLIKAMSALKKDLPNARLWLLGDGDMKSSLEKEAQKLGVADAVSFLGRKDNPSPIISSCDLYVSASKCEGLPFNIVEALSAKRTVIASDIKGHRDILGDGAGFLFAPDNLAGFCHLVKEFCLGRISIPESLMDAAFYKFSHGRVFEQTLKKIKEAADL